MGQTFKQLDIVHNLEKVQTAMFVSGPAQHLRENITI